MFTITFKITNKFYTLITNFDFFNVCILRTLITTFKGYVIGVQLANFCYDATFYCSVQNYLLFAMNCLHKFRVLQIVVQVRRIAHHSLSRKVAVNVNGESANECIIISI